MQFMKQILTANMKLRKFDTQFFTKPYLESLAIQNWY